MKEKVFSTAENATGWKVGDTVQRTTSGSDYTNGYVGEIKSFKDTQVKVEFNQTRSGMKLKPVLVKSCHYKSLTKIS